MNRINRRLLIPIGAAAGVLLLWFVVLWGPQGSALSKAKQRASDAVSRRATLQDQLRRLQAARQDQPLKQSQLETLRVAVPDDPNLAQFILDANDAANASGIDFLSISPTPPAPTVVTPPPTTPTTVAGAPSGTTATTAATGATGATGTGSAAPAAIKMSMSITGGYFQVLDFINRLDKLSRIVVIDGLSIGTSGGAAASQASSGGAPQLAVTLQARMFTTNATPVSGGGTSGTGAATGGATTTTTAAGGATTTSTTAVGGR